MNRKFKKGDIFSENTYHKITDVIDVFPPKYIVGDNLSITEQYLVKKCVSADYFEDTQKVTATRLREIVLENPGIAMTINFDKKVKEKDVVDKLYKEINNLIKTLSPIQRSDIESIVLEGGENRTMRGYHNGQFNPSSRLIFTDLDVTDGNTRQADLRTLKWVIVNNVKYTIK